MHLSSRLTFLLTIALVAIVKADRCDDAEWACLHKGDTAAYCESQKNFCKMGEPH